MPVTGVGSCSAGNDDAGVTSNISVVVVRMEMSVVEREETRAKTELGATQKDTAR